MFAKLARALLVMAVLVAAPAHATPQGIREAIAAMDIKALRSEAEAGSPAERQLAAGIELGWTSHDAAATFALSAAVDAQTDPSLKAAGLRALMSLHMRRGEFAAAGSAGLRASAIEPLDAGEQQALTFIQSLVGIPPTRALGDPSGEAPIKRDLAGLRRSDIRVGDQSVSAILDTGANFSTINTTSAQRLGLRMLDAAVSVGSSSRDAVASRLGVAETLSIGGAEFSNVVFIVLPDADLSFANGAYTIDAILGMPVFLQMKRMEFTLIDGQETFAFGDEAVGVGDAQRNLLFSGLSPMVDVSIAVKGQALDLRLLLDSGAQKTSFEGRFTEVAAHLLGDAPTVTATRGGAGGSVTSDTTKRIPSLDLTVANKTVTLTNVDAHPSGRQTSLGILGLDVFGGGFVIDWDAGVFVTSDIYIPPQ